VTSALTSAFQAWPESRNSFTSRWNSGSSSSHAAEFTWKQSFCTQPGATSGCRASVVAKSEMVFTGSITPRKANTPGCAVQRSSCWWW
jgi:hypothetical protein